MAPASFRAQALRVFAVAWAIAIVFDFGSIHRWDRTIYDALLVFAAFATICRGGALAPFLLMAALQAFTSVARSPVVSNHWLFMGFVSGGLLLAYLLLALRDGRARVDLAELYDHFAPAGRLCLLLLYFYVVFHKLNRGFVDPAQSSGALFWHAHAELFPFLPSGETGALIGAYSTLILEALIPLFLVFKATRALGVVMGVVFHGFIGISPLGRFWDFSSVMYALYVLFLPEATWHHWQQRWPAIRDARWVRAMAGWPVALKFGLAAGGALVVLAYLVSGPGAAINERPYLSFWVVYAFAFLLFVVPPLRALPATERPMLLVPRPVLLLAPALVLLNGLNPYLGLKTESSFAMFSNLQTENGRSNHLLVPAWVQVFPFQRDCVEILETTNEELRLVQEEGRLLTLFELRQLAARSPGGTARIVYQGQEYTFEPFRSDGDLLRRPNPLLDRFLRFRPIYADGRSGNWH